MPLQLHTVSLNQLQSRDPAVEATVAQVITHAFGAAGPGLFLVNGLGQQFAIDRTNLLAASRALVALPEPQLQRLEMKHLNYSYGWSRGNEAFKGVIDTKKGSFYANPIYDDPAQGNSALSTKYPHHMSRNIWPADLSCKLLEPSFQSIGRYVNDIGLHVARHCDNFVRDKIGTNHHFSSLEHSLQVSRAAKGRLLNYFPSDGDVQPSPHALDINDDDLWCGYHNDHGTLTGLIASQYYIGNCPEPLASTPDSRAGLYVHRQDEDTPEKVVIPQDCIAFQIGESAQIVSGGILRATPHAVMMTKTNIANVTRVAMAVFLQPNPWEPLEMPHHYGPAERDAALQISSLVPSLRSGRYEQGDLFAHFSTKTIKAYCRS